MKFLRLAALPAFSLLTYLLPSARGHAFGASIDLPIPLYLYYFGGATVVALSFLIISFFVKKSGSPRNYRTYNLLRNPFVSRIAESRYLLAAFKLPSVILLLLVVSAGLLGTQVAVFNFAPIFVWIIWWVGSAFVHVFIGNVWQFANPWKTVFDSVKRGEPGEPRLAYPRRLGVWPAFFEFFVFVWIELMFPDPAVPRNVAALTLLYSAVTWVGMALFGAHLWMRYCDPFAVFFSYLSKLAPTEVRVTNVRICDSCHLDCETGEKECVNCYECYEQASSEERQLNLRLFAAGLLRLEDVSFDRVAFILLMLAAVTFDGLSRTLAWHSLLGVPPLAPRSWLIWINTIGFANVFALFLLIYLVVSWLANTVAGTDLSVRSIAFPLAVSLLPIAMVYQLAHYSIYLFVNGQMIIRLASDPFGYGWDLFGTANFAINTKLNFVWVWHYLVGLIVAGHVMAVYVAHILALKIFPTIKSAVKSQYPMLMLMIGYTSAGLWLLSAPGVG